MKYLICFSLLFIFTAISPCNAQTLSTPSLQSPTYDILLTLPQSTVEENLSFTSILEVSPNETFTIPISKSKSNLLKVSTISPTHYADTHNAFFCRMERKINKKFIMPVRIRLEGF